MLIETSHPNLIHCCDLLDELLTSLTRLCFSSNLLALQPHLILLYFNGNEYDTQKIFSIKLDNVPVMEKVLCSPHYERSGWPQELLHRQPLLHCWQILSGFLSSHWKTLPHHQVEVICQLTLPGKDNHNQWKQTPLFMHWLAMMMYLHVSFFIQRFVENNAMQQSLLIAWGRWIFQLCQ